MIRNQNSFKIKQRSPNPERIHPNILSLWSPRPKVSVSQNHYIQTEYDGIHKIVGLSPRNRRYYYGHYFESESQRLSLSLLFIGLGSYKKNNPRTNTWKFALVWSGSISCETHYSTSLQCFSLRTQDCLFHLGLCPIVTVQCKLTFLPHEKGT